MGLRRGVLGSIGLVLLLALPVALPIPELPTPSGPFSIGTRTFQLVDFDLFHAFIREQSGDLEFLSDRLTFAVQTMTMEFLALACAA